MIAMDEDSNTNYPLLGALAAETKKPKAAGRHASPLSRAIRAATEAEADDTKRLKRLAGEDVNLRNPTSGWTLLHGQARGGDAQAITVLVKAGANVNTADTGGATPLHVAAQFGHAQAATALAEAGADVNLATEIGNTPLHLAAQFGNAQTITALAEAGADVNAASADGDTPLHSAIHLENTQTIAALVSVGADVNRQDKTFEDAPLHLAVRMNKLQAIAALIKSGADVSLTDKNGDTPLHRAAYNGHAQAIAALVGINKHWSVKLRQVMAAFFGLGAVNRRNKDGYTPLHIAAISGHAQAITALAKVGAAVNRRDANRGYGTNWIPDRFRQDKLYGGAPLHWAAQHGRTQALTALAESGAAINMQDTLNENSPLHWAAVNGNAQAITTLTDIGANVNMTNKDNMTPLHSAAAGGHVEAIVALVKAGANVNPEDINGDTPLYWAADKGHKKAMEQLIKFGAWSTLPPGNYPVFPCPVNPKSKCGYIYVAANDSLGYGVLKIGMTTRAPEKRLAELSGTSLPTPFVCLLVLAASDARGAERIIHRALDEYRMSEGREFFCITPTSLESVLSELAGKPIKMTAME